MITFKLVHVRVLNELDNNQAIWRVNKKFEE